MDRHDRAVSYATLVAYLLYLGLIVTALLAMAEGAIAGA
jgi:hypothetical protein